jgi:hypothetical protein
MLTFYRCTFKRARRAHPQLQQAERARTPDDRSPLDDTPKDLTFGSNTTDVLQ